jgi:hypothetical protein
MLEALKCRRDNDNGNRNKEGRTARLQVSILSKMNRRRATCPVRHSKEGTMRIPENYSQQEMEFIELELPTAPGVPVAPCDDEAATLSRVGATSKVVFDRLRSIERVNRLEESLYWLLSAATLIYLLVGIIGH